MNIINVVKSAGRTVSLKGGRTLLLAKKFSPEILTGAGIVGGIMSGILACKATLKVEEVMDQHECAMAQIRAAESKMSSAYLDKDAQKDKAIVYGRTGLELVKLYAPPVALGAASIGCILGGHGILSKRNAAIAAAYSMVQDRLNDYRQRVVDELGEEKDKEFFHGTTTETVTVTEEDESGKKRKIKKTVHRPKDPNNHSIYARFFDEASPQWQSVPEYNLLFLKTQQNYLNDLLRARGHVFLNEVYDALGIPRSGEGAVVGWVMSTDGDNFIDFGMYDLDNPQAADFVNGYEKSILLDFNVDGVIFDLI